MRAEDNPLDLNNFPDDFSSKDCNQAVLVDGSSSSAGNRAGAGAGAGHRKKKGVGKEGNEEKGKVYECRFCSLKFCKSQALGGHMNRHRQERETENLNRARQLVFGNDALPPPHHHHRHHHHHHLGAYHPGSHMSDPTLAFRSPSSSLYAAPRSASSSALFQPFLYQSPQPQLMPYPSSSSQHDFFLGGHGLDRPNQYSGLHGSTHGHGSGLASGISSDPSMSYTCIGEPVGEVGGGEPYRKEGLSWGRTDPNRS